MKLQYRLYSDDTVAEVYETIASENIWVKLFRNGPSKICGRLPKKTISL